ncbi:MAG: response regulator [Anaerolineae bacterium]|nr:response regulator [Anaerolineae bacterium]
MQPPNTILIVDNEFNVRDDLKDFLMIDGFQVFAAGSADEALEILKHNRIYLAIIDVRLKDDNDPHDMSGLDFAAQLAPEVAKIILTGFRTEDLIRQAMNGYKNQITPAYDVLAKQEGPEKLLDTVKDVFTRKINSQINLSLEITYDEGYSLSAMMAPLQETIDFDLEESEVEELFRRLFRQESSIKIYYLPPGRGGASVALVKPTYNGIDGHPIVVKFGLANHIDREVAAYREFLEPFAHRYSTVIIDQPARTHHLAACKLLFVGHSVDKPRSFNTVYKDQTILDAMVQKIVHNIFVHSCGIWYKGKRRWQESDGPFSAFMNQQLSLHLDAERSELKTIINALVDDSSDNTFRRINPQTVAAKVDDTFIELADPLYVLAHLGDCLPKPSFVSVTHGDLNGHNLFIDESGSPWLIDFYRTGWGPALRDAAELESAIKFELLESTNLQALFQFEQTLLAPNTYSEQIVLPSHRETADFKRALIAIQAIREAARSIAETEHIDEYYALLLFYALKMITWQGMSAADRDRKSIRRRHALYSAALISTKLTAGH